MWPRELRCLGRMASATSAPMHSLRRLAGGRPGSASGMVADHADRAGRFALPERLGLCRQPADGGAGTAGREGLAGRRRCCLRRLRRRAGRLTGGLPWRERSCEPRRTASSRAPRRDRARFAAWCAGAGRLARRLRAVHGAGVRRTPASPGGTGRRRWRRATPAALEQARGAARRRNRASGISCNGASTRQCAALKDYANARGVSIMGDLPIFVAHHSADCWARPDLYSLDETASPPWSPACRPTTSARSASAGATRCIAGTAWRPRTFAWWTARVRRALDSADVLRIDHFRGFAGYWEIPGQLPDRDRRPLGARARARNCSRRSPRALGDAADRRRGPGPDHARRDRAARRLRLPRHAHPAVRLWRRRRP